MSDPVNRFQTEGEICESCLRFWNAQGLPPKRIISVGVTTDKKKIPIDICAHCDGDAILRFHGVL